MMPALPMRTGGALFLWLNRLLALLAAGRRRRRRRGDDR